MDQEQADYADNDLPPPGRLRRKLFRAFIAWLITCSVLIALIGLIVYLVIPTDYSDRARGSPELAAHWRSELVGYGNPEAAQSARPEVVGKRFPNGEWAFGMDRDSHAYRDGGTVVIKDSTGRVRVFFGHVCGSILPGVLNRANSLDEVYQDQQWRVFQFAEYHFPDDHP
jgi:hypothetical protein